MFTVCLFTGGGVPVIQNFVTRCPTDLAGGGSQKNYFPNIIWGGQKSYFSNYFPYIISVGGP